MNIVDIDNQMYELQKVCNRYKSTDPLADWVLFALNRYFYTGRSTKQFEELFCKLDADNLLEMVKYCLNRDRSDDGIIKSVRCYIAKVNI